MPKVPARYRGKGLYFKGHTIYVTIRHNKKPFTFCTGTSDPDEANEFRLDKIAELRTQEAAMAVRGVRMDELFTDYIKFLERKERGRTDYANVSTTETNSYKTANLIKNHLSHLNDFKPEQITTALVNELHDKQLDDGYSISSANGVQRTLRAAMNLGARATPRKVNPLLIPKFPIDMRGEEASERTGTIDDEAYQKIMSELADHLKPVFAVAITTGMRSKEIKFVRPEQVDWKSSLIELRNGETKNGKARVCPVNDELKGVLWEWYERTQSEYPATLHFFHYKGKRLKSWKTAWNAALGRAGYRVPVLNPDGSQKIVKKVITVRKNGQPVLDGEGNPRTRIKLTKVWKNLILFHDARRTAETNDDVIGVQERDSMKVRGHKTESQSRKYNRSKEAAERVRQAQNAALKAKNGEAAPVAPAAPLRDWKADLKDLKETLEAGLLPEDLYKIEVAKVMASR